MHSTYDAVFDNVKLISANPMNVNGDGFDWQGGGRTRIMNSLVRSSDDCFAFFTYDPAAELPTGSKPDAEAVKRSSEVKDVSIENCVLWTTIANIYRVGGGGMSLRTENITMRNCDIIHCGRGEWLAPWSMLCVVNNGDPAPSVHNNYLFENIRLEEANAFIGMQNEDASFENLVFRNVVMNGNIVPSMIKCPVVGLTFENVVVNGKRVKSSKDVPFGTVTKEIKNLVYK
jgi:polygalacturonase